jgi:type I restriction enzyme S subunit
MEWPLARLDSLYDIARGGSPRPIKDFITEDPNGINWVKIGDATASGKFIYETKQKIKPEGIQRSRFVNKGDFILSNSMSFGRPYIMGTSGCIHDGWLVLSAKDERIDQDFLYHMLGSPFVFNQFDTLAAGSTVRNLNIDLVSGVKIPLLPITEQKRIVALLDTVFVDLEQTRAKTEQNLKNSRELFDSYLQQVFSQKGDGWVEKTLKEASLDFGRGKSKHRPRNDASLYGGEYPFVQTGDVRNCEHLITKYSKTYNEVGLAQSKLWPKGTICITIAANIAETGILDFDSCFPDSVIGVVVNPEVTTIPYVEFLLQSFKAILQAKGKGSAQANINMGTFEKLKFPFPSIDKQNEIVNSLNEIMISVQKLEVIYQKKLSSIDELKKSILQKAFSGELNTIAN